MSRTALVLTALMAVALTGCETNQAGNSVKSVGQSVGDAIGGAAKGAVSLVNVNLSNVLNDLALDLKIDKANIPINAQIPITLAANVCGVSINILSVSNGGSPNCTANSTSPELSQAVQQQLAANGSVDGGNQTGTGATGTAGGGGAAAASAPTSTNTGTGTGGSTSAGSTAPTGSSTTGTQQQTPAQ